MANIKRNGKRNDSIPEKRRETPGAWLVSADVALDTLLAVNAVKIADILIYYDCKLFK
jgi:hypothetical protein